MRALAIDGSAGGRRLKDPLPLANEIARLSGATMPRVVGSKAQHGSGASRAAGTAHPRRVGPRLG